MKLLGILTVLKGWHKICYKIVSTTKAKEAIMLATSIAKRVAPFSSLFDMIESGSSRCGSYKISDKEIRVELPGVEKENISLISDGDILRLKWKEEDDDDYKALSFISTRGVEVSATYKNGLLKIKFKKDKSTEEKSIEIK